MAARAVAVRIYVQLRSGGVASTAMKRSPGQVDQTRDTIGNWHRVGFNWDGSNQILYVDDMEVARDPQANLPSFTGGLYIGAGSTLASGTFWKGLVDDVRIYNRAVKP
jgi:hypothetical protein